MANPERIVKHYAIARDLLIPVIIGIVGLVGSLGGVYLANVNNTKQAELQKTTEFETRILEQRLALIDRAAKIFGKSPGLNDVWEQYLKDSARLARRNSGRQPVELIEKLTEAQGEFQSVLMLARLYFGSKTNQALTDLSSIQGPWWTKPKDKQDALLVAMSQEIYIGLKTLPGLVAVNESADDLNKFGIPFFSMVGEWVSGIGALGAIIAALYIASRQSRESRAQDAVRGIHHSMAIINDLRGRIHYLKTVLTEGNRPLAALTRNADLIQKRYETLYDQNIYQCIPGNLIDAILEMSGSFLGISVGVASIASSLGNIEHLTLNIEGQFDIAPLTKCIEKLDSELIALFTGFEKLRGEYA